MPILREWTAEEKAAEAAIAENNDPTYPLTPIDRTNTRIIAQDEVNAAYLEHHIDSISAELAASIPMIPDNQYPSIPSPKQRQPETNPRLPVAAGEDEASGSAMRNDMEEEEEQVVEVPETMDLDDLDEEAEAEVEYEPDVNFGPEWSLVAKYRDTVPAAVADASKPKQMASDADDGQEYEVEWIGAARFNTRRKKVGTRLQYHVKWVGFDRMTWENKAGLEDTQAYSDVCEEHDELPEKYRDEEVAVPKKRQASTKKANAPAAKKMRK